MIFLAHVVVAVVVLRHIQVEGDLLCGDSCRCSFWIHPVELCFSLVAGPARGAFGLHAQWVVHNCRLAVLWLPFAAQILKCLCNTPACLAFHFFLLILKFLFLRVNPYMILNQVLSFSWDKQILLSISLYL